jgi:Co/Zn/Cd efflux system component
MASTAQDDAYNSDSSEGSFDEVTTDEVADVDLAHSHRPEGIYAVAKAASGKGSKKERLTPNIKALILTAFLFTLITVVQVFAAKVAHSQALLMDCISMGVDALTYMGNIVVECRKRDGTDHKGSQLIVCAISLSLLLYFTWDASQESIATIQVCRGKAPAEADEDDVNGYITLAFGAGGVIFDAISLYAFYASNRKQGDGRAVNMFTALLHVSADFLRSTSTVVMSLLILVGGFDSTCLDAYTSMLIGASIVAGGLFGLFNWFKLFLEYFGCIGGG